MMLLHAKSPKNRNSWKRISSIISLVLVNIVFLHGPWPLEYLFPPASTSSSFLDAIENFSIDTVGLLQPLDHVAAFARGQHFGMNKCHVEKNNPTNTSSMSTCQHGHYTAIALRYRNARQKGFTVALSLSPEELKVWKKATMVIHMEQVDNLLIFECYICQRFLFFEKNVNMI